MKIVGMSFSGEEISRILYMFRLKLTMGGLSLEEKKLQERFNEALSLTKEENKS